VFSLTGRVALMELAPPILERALHAFPKPVRTLDAPHLASVEFLMKPFQAIRLATYDRRMLAAAEAWRIPLVEFV
jgi:hypothetical protein